MVQISIASAAASFLQEFSQSVACNLSETFQPTVTHLVVFRLGEVTEGKVQVPGFPASCPVFP